MKRYKVGLAGESNYRAAVSRMRPGMPVDLVPEPDNAYDPRAIRAAGPDGETIGYVPKGSWLTRAMLDEDWDVRARVASVEGGRPGAPDIGLVLDVFMLDEPDERIPPFSPSVLPPEQARAPGVSTPARPKTFAVSKVKMPAEPSGAAKTGMILGVAVLFVLFIAVIGMTAPERTTAPVGDDTFAPVPAAAPAPMLAGRSDAPQIAAPVAPEPEPDATWNADADYVRESAITLCTQQWPDDLALRGGCRRNAESGAESFRQIAEAHAGSADMQRSLAGCFAEWTSGGVTDFALLGGCARNAEQGLQEMMR